MTLRSETIAIALRLKRAQSAFERLYGAAYGPDDMGGSAEVLRNLGSAVAHIEIMLGMSDEALFNDRARRRPQEKP